MNKRQVRFAAAMYYAAAAQKRPSRAKPAAAKATRKPTKKVASKQPPVIQRPSWRTQILNARLRFVIPAALLFVALLMVLSSQYHTTSQHTKAPLQPPVVHQDVMKPVPVPTKVTAHTSETTIKALGDKTTCPHGTQLTVVAHQDDDILFMNPALQQSIANGWCVRTVYVTAGDDGKDSTYWQVREQGPEAAYAAMFNVPNQWTNQTLQLSSHQVTVYSLDGMPRVSLVFMRLPDGNVDGQGFGVTNNQSLRGLRSGENVSLTSLDGASTYSRSDLINALRNLIDLDKPKIINTQAFSAGLARGDHSDHQAVGYFTSIAAAAVNKSVTIHRYIGYEVGNLTPNLTDDQITSKFNIFSAYDAYDPMVCNDSMGCFNSYTYVRYLSRQYEQVNPGS